MTRPSDRQTRRRFLQGSLALAGFGLLAGCGSRLPSAQPAPQIHRIGYLMFVGEPRIDGERLEAFRGGLRDLGYQEGQNLVIEVRGTERPEQLPELAAELVGLPVEVIVASPTRAALAAKAATSTIPIVFARSGEPLETGLVESLARPGGNVTGLMQLVPQLAGKRLELLKEVMPSLRRIAILWNATSPIKVLEYNELQPAAQVLGVQVRSLPINGPSDIAPALESARASGAEALLPLAEPVVNSQRAQVLDFVTRYRLPTVYDGRDFVEDGGLLSYGVHLLDLHRRAATYVDKILKGTKPADLPVEGPTKFELVINLKTAQALGLTIPQSVLVQATEIIQ